MDHGLETLSLVAAGNWLLLNFLHFWGLDNLGFIKVFQLMREHQWF
jgi:hypothetical protein